MAQFGFGFDGNEVLTRLFKYVFEGLIVAVAAFVVPSRHTLSIQDIVLLGLIAAATFSILDLFAPSIGSTVRQGAGFSLGAGLVGGVPTSAGRFG
jgi:ABC-type Co2+ transport system permease subunit